MKSCLEAYMDGNSSRVDVFSTPTKLMIAVMALVLLLGPTALIAQNATGSLSGTVLDASGAVVPKATVTMTNELSQTRRQTVSNNSGYFNIAAVPPGSYTVFIEAQGFAKWETKNLRFNQGENHAIPNIQLRPGSEGTLVEVVATPDQAPLETGESRETLNGTMVSQISIQGRDAAELMKIMPGMSINSGLGQSQWSSLTTGTNSGPVGNYSASGTPPSGALSLTTDGANIVDSGNQGTQISNINQDQTAEVTILNSAYGAEYAKGPVTFQAISKSGGNTYHGSGYLYTRNGALNAFDWQMKNNHLSNPTDSTTSKPSDSYYYPGFTFGGPVLIP